VRFERLWRRLRRTEPLTDADWRAAWHATPWAARLSAGEQARLRTMTEAFLRHKHFDGAAGFEVSDAMRAVIALRACVPVLHLGLERYDGWSGIVVYPGDFRVDEEYEDEIGVVHRGQADLCGQSIAHGPMVLSWEAVAHPPAPDQDLVVHECAHKLDTQNGPADGFPPLPAGLSASDWTHDFTEAFKSLTQQLERDEEPRLDPYAAADPAEFFAVACETFFTQPAILAEDFPAVYRQLQKFFRQDPLAHR